MRVRNIETLFKFSHADLGKTYEEVLPIFRSYQ